MIAADELQIVLTLVEKAQEGAIHLRLKHLDDAAAFESILDSLHHAATKLSSLVESSR